MTLTRHQRALQKIEAIRASRRLQGLLNEPVSRQTGLPDTESVDEPATMSMSMDMNMNLPPSSRIEEEISNDESGEIPMKSLPGPVQDMRERLDDSCDEQHPDDENTVESPTGEDTSEIAAEDRWEDSSKHNRNSPVRGSPIRCDEKTPKKRIGLRSRVENEDLRTSRSFAAMDDDTPPRSATRFRNVYSKKSAVAKRSSRRVRGRSRCLRDASPDSRSEGTPSDGLAGSLDHVFDFLWQDDQSMDDTLSARSERTEESFTAGSYSHKVKDDDVLKAVEDLFIGRCCQGVECEDIDDQTLSVDDPNLYGPNERRKRKINRLKKQYLRAPRNQETPRNAVLAGEDFSAEAAEDESTLGTLTTMETKESSRCAGTTSDTERDMTQVASFDTRENGECAQVWQMASNLIDDAAAVITQTSNENQAKIQEFIEEARYHAEKATMEIPSDASFHSTLHASLQETATYTSGMMSSIREVASFSGSSKPVNKDESALAINDENESPPAAGKAVSHQSTEISETQCETATSLPDSSAKDGQAYMYAPAETVERSDSFFSAEAEAPEGATPVPSLEETMGNLPNSISERLEELRQKLNDMDFSRSEESWLAQKFHEIFSCPKLDAETQTTPKSQMEDSSNAAKETEVETCEPHKSGEDTEKAEQTQSSAAETFVQVFSCSIAKPDPDAALAEDLVFDSNVVSHELPVTVDRNSAHAEPLGLEWDPKQTEMMCTDNVELEPSGDIVKNASGDPLEGHSVGTPDTSKSTEDGLEEGDDGIECTRSEDFDLFATARQDDFIQPFGQQDDDIANSNPSQDIQPFGASTSTKKKSGQLRRAIKFIPSLFLKKRGGARTKRVGSSSGTSNSESKANATSDFLASSKSSHTADMSSTFVNSSAEGLLGTGPFDSATSTEAKRESLRNCENDGFDNIMSIHARVNDWQQMFPDLEAATEASF